MPLESNYLDIVRNPLAQAGSTSCFLRLVLAEAGAYGMPGHVIAMLDDLAAMLGFYDPLPPPQAAYLSGPLVNWRTHPNQPTFDRVHDVEALAMKQRALIAFGGGPSDQMVGTAEIVIAMGNIVQGTSPPEYYEVFMWASIDVLRTITGDDEKTILADPNKKGWHAIKDEEVTKPGGRLYPTYQEVTTSIRRSAIAAVKGKLADTRAILRPLAAHILEQHEKMRREAQHEGLSDIVERLDAQTDIVRGMFPEVSDVGEEVDAFNKRVEQARAE